MLLWARLSARGWGNREKAQFSDEPNCKSQGVVSCITPSALCGAGWEGFMEQGARQEVKSSDIWCGPWGISRDFARPQSKWWQPSRLSECVARIKVRTRRGKGNSRDKLGLLLYHLLPCGDTAQVLEGFLLLFNREDHSHINESSFPSYMERLSD